MKAYTKVLPPGARRSVEPSLSESPFMTYADVNRRVESLFRRFDVRRVGAIDKQQVSFSAFLFGPALQAFKPDSDSSL